MADIVKKQPQSVPETMQTTYKDMGDGTHALVVAAGSYMVDSGSIDAFARLRVSNPTGLFDSQMQYDTQPLLWNEKITNNSGNAVVTHAVGQSSVFLTVGAADTVIRQTKAYHRYQPGRSQFVLATFDGFVADSTVTRRVGYFDNQNGIFLQETNGTLSIVRRSFASGGAVDTAIAQADWNIDKFNGTGNSEITLDITKSQILLIDLEWLGVGRVRVGFVVDGIPYYAHEFVHANVSNGVYMTTANLPIRYEISAAAGASGTHSLQQICSQVSSEGGFEDERGTPLAAGNDATTVSVNARRPIASIRPRALFNSIINRGQILPEGIDVFAEDENTYFEVVYGGTLTNASWANVDASYSLAELDVAATAITGGIKILAGYSPTGGSHPISERAGKSAVGILSKLPLSLDVDGAHPTTPLTDSISVVCTTLIDATSDTAASIHWRELR